MRKMKESENFQELEEEKKKESDQVDIGNVRKFIKVSGIRATNFENMKINDGNYFHTLSRIIVLIFCIQS